MVALITDPALEQQLIAERQASGADKYDEVWEGVYVMAPLANNEHQDLVKELTTVLTISVDWPGLGKVYPGVNVSDRREDWKQNYRCPDVAVFLKDTGAESCETHWYGGPDLVVEIASSNERVLEKLPFYAKIGTRELMVIDRDPWQITLYRLQGGKLELRSSSTLEDSKILSSEVVPLSWRLVSGDKGPGIEIIHQDGDRRWLVKIGTG